MTHSFPSMPLLPPSATHLASEEAHALMRANLHAHGVDFVTNDATGRRLELASVHDLTLDDTLCLALVHRIGEDVGPLVVSTTLSGRLRLHRPFGWVPVDSLIAAWNAARRAARPRHALIELVRLRYEATWFDVPRVMGCPDQSSLEALVWRGLADSMAGKRPVPHEFVAGRDPYDRSVVRRAARVCGAYFAWRWPVVFGNLSGAIANHPLAYHLVAGRPRNDRVVRTVMAEPADAELLLRYGFSLPTDCPDAELNARMDRLADWLASPAALRRAAAILDGRTVDEREQIKSRMGEDRA